MANQLKMGVVLSYVNIFVNMIVGLVYTPIMIRLLGQSEYGLYSLIGALVGYLSVLDMGLGNTIVRYIARNRVIGDRLSQNNLNGLFLILYCIIGFLTVIIGSVLYFHIDSMFADTLTHDELYKAKIMTILLVFNFAITFPLGVFASIMQAYEKFIILRGCNIARVLLNPIIVLPFLYLGYGSIMMVVVTTILNVSCLIINVYYCFKYLNVGFSFARYNYDFLYEVAGYSFFIFLNIIVDKIYWSTGQFILGITSGTFEVAVYAIAMQFIMLYMMFSTAISGVLLPKVTMMVANNATPSQLTEVMIKIGRVQFLIVGYFFIMFCLVGKMFIYLWAGTEYLDAYFIVCMIMAAIIFPLLQNTGIAILQAQNRNKFRMIVLVIIATLNVLVSFVLSKTYGGIGCAYATACAQLLGQVIINGYYYYKIKIDIPLFWKNIIQISRWMLFGTIISYGMTYFFKDYNWHNFIMLSIIISSIYAIVVFKYAINNYEKGLISIFTSRINFFKLKG